MAQAETGSAPFLLPVRIWGRTGMAEPSQRRSSRSGSSRKARKPPSAPRRPNTKQTGERSEAAFLHRASALGFGVAKPWGDSLRYDFILDNGERLWRIQIKCTESIRAQAYETRATYSIGKGRAVYTTHDTDFIAAHIVPLDIWYILPVAVCTPQPMLRFYPHRQAKKMRLEKYRELWTQLKPQSPGPHGPITIQAVADETTYPDLDSHATPQALSSGRQQIPPASLRSRVGMTKSRRTDKESRWGLARRNGMGRGPGELRQ